jgi:hypothetical protein
MRIIYLSVPSVPNTGVITLETIMEFLETKEMEEYIIIDSDKGYWQATPKDDFAPIPSIDWISILCETITNIECRELTLAQTLEFVKKWNLVLPVDPNLDMSKK